MILNVYRKLLVSLVGLIFFICSNAYAESDVSGWGKTKWGMTHSEVSKIYPLLDWDKSMNNTCLAKDGLNLQGHNFRLHFQFDKENPAGKLIKVVIGSKEVPDKVAESIIGLIVGKYGEINNRQYEFGFETMHWFRKSGQIEVTRLRELGGFSVSYISTNSVNEKI